MDHMGTSQRATFTGDFVRNKRVLVRTHGVELDSTSHAASRPFRGGRCDHRAFFVERLDVFADTIPAHKSLTLRRGGAGSSFGNAQYRVWVGRRFKGPDATAAFLRRGGGCGRNVSCSVETSIMARMSQASATPRGDDDMYLA